MPADPLKVIAEAMSESVGYIAHAEAVVVLDALKAAGFMLVPVEVSAAPQRIRWEDLKPGMVVRMKKGGVRRITEIDPNRHGLEQKWSTVRWVRIDGTAYKGRTGNQTAYYFAKDAAEVLTDG